MLLAFWMCGNIGPSQVNTCPFGITIEIYGTSYPGNGDCKSGFSAARNVYALHDPLTGMAVSFEMEHRSCAYDEVFRLYAQVKVVENRL